MPKGYPCVLWIKRITDPDTGRNKFIDYDKDSYRDQWTGKGYYKSSAKNAMRVTRTETNMAYRAADNARWEQLDFIRGIRIKPSESHPQQDICDMLAGDYPKTFKFSGWHPQSFCIMTPILPTDEEMLAMADARANGEEYTPTAPLIIDYPQGFKDFVYDNAERIKQARLSATEPYFLRDNRDDVNKALKLADKVIVGNDEYTVRDLISQSKITETENGKVYLHPSHGKTEKPENLEFAKWRANSFGEEVILLPNPQGVTSADSFNITRGVQEEYKLNITSSKSSIDNLLRKGKDQADYIVLEVNSDISLGDLTDAITSRIYNNPKNQQQRCPNLKELRLKIGNAEAVYTRSYIVSGEFKIKPEDFITENFRSLGTRENDPITIAKLNKFFNSTKSAPKPSPIEIAAKRHAARTPELKKAIQQVWNYRRISRLNDAVASGLLPKECVAGLHQLSQNELNGRIKFLQQRAEKHTERTPEDIERIQKTWNERRLLHAMDGITELDVYKDQTLHDLVRLLEDDIALSQQKFFESDFADFKRMIKAARDVEYMNTERLMNTPLFQANNDDVEKIFGARGMAMPFKPANELRGNPHFYESEAYRVNCQTCVVANELRRRGFNLEALANTKGSALERLSYHTEAVWLDADGNIPQSTLIGWRKVKKKMWNGQEFETWEQTAKNRKQLVSALESELVDDGRYHIKWNWSKGNSGHIITVERVNGKLRYYDPQTGRVIDDFAQYLNGAKVKDGIRCLRVDNLRVNPDIAGKVLTKPTAAKFGAAATGGTARLPQRRINEIRKTTEQWCNENLPRTRLPDGNVAKRAIVRHSSGSDIVVNSGSFGEIWYRNQNRNNLDEILNIARDYNSWLPNAEWIREENGIHHAFPFNVYEATINGQRIEVKTKLTDAEYLYNIRFV